MKELMEIYTEIDTDDEASVAKKQKKKEKIKYMGINFDKTIKTIFQNLCGVNDTYNCQLGGNKLSYKELEISDLFLSYILFTFLALHLFFYVVYVI